MRKRKKPYVKSSYYRYTFKTCFNIDFHIPKIDRYEKCEEIKIKKNENISITNEENHLQDLHISEKLAMREKKDKDKLLIKDENYLLVVFDLENVITLPKADVRSFFYKRRMPLYNLIAMTSKRLLRNLDGRYVRSCRERPSKCFHSNA